MPNRVSPSMTTSAHGVRSRSSIATAVLHFGGVRSVDIATLPGASDTVPAGRTVHSGRPSLPYAPRSMKARVLLVAPPRRRSSACTGGHLADLVVAVRAPPRLGLGRAGRAEDRHLQHRVRRRGDRLRRGGRSRPRASTPTSSGSRRPGGTSRISPQVMGWPYYDTSTQLVSTLPLLAPPDGDGTYTYVEVEPGRVVAIGNVHLPSAPVRAASRHADRQRRRQIVALEERVRIPALEPIATPSGRPGRHRRARLPGRRLQLPLAPGLDRGDGRLASSGRFPVAWPDLDAHGRSRASRDSFREVHPDPVAEPGLTWPAARPRTPDGWNPGPKNASPIASTSCSRRVRSRPWTASGSARRAPRTSR